jgi:hypothetical protein
MINLTPQEIEIVKSAGFKIFGDKIVAADQGSSGLATQSVINLINLLKAKQ